MDVFQKRLADIGADFPGSFINNLDRLIVTMHPKYKRRIAKAKAASGEGLHPTGSSDEKRLQARKFPGLSVPDEEWRPAEKYLSDRSSKEPAETLPPSISHDSTMAELAQVAARRSRPAAEDYLDGEPSNKRARNGESGGNHLAAPVRHEFDDGYRGRQPYHNHGDGSHGRSRPILDDRPVLYKIYDGVVQNIRDFGAFVTLEGIQGRTEGEKS